MLPPCPSLSPSIPAALGIPGCLLAGDAADCHPPGGAEALCPVEDGDVAAMSPQQLQPPISPRPRLLSSGAGNGY